MLSLDKFQEIELQLNQHITSMVTDAKKQIEDLQATLKSIATRYPTNETVQLHLAEYLPKVEVKEIPTIVAKKRVAGRSRGRPRIHPTLVLEFNDGVTVQLKYNPSRAALAKLIKENPSGVESFSYFGEFNQHVNVKHVDNESHFRFTNPLPLNTSGIKSVSAC